MLIVAICDTYAAWRHEPENCASANRKLSRYDKHPARMPFRLISFQKETD